MYLKRVILFLWIAISFNGYAGANICESQASGNWSDASTWVNCANNIPMNSDSVIIKGSHTVILNVNSNELEAMTVEVGGDFDVAFDAAGLTLSGSSNVATFDLINASINLFGDFTIDAPFKNINLGSVDGAFDLIVNNSNMTQFSANIGNINALSSLTTDFGGVTELAADVSLNVDQINVNDGLNNAGFELTINNTGLSQFNINISGTGGLRKLGIGNLVLADNNTYTGETQLIEGMLTLLDSTNANPIAASSIINLTPGAIFSPTNVMAFSVANGQTLSGVGTITSNVSTQIGAKIFPQYNSIDEIVGGMTALDTVIEGGSEFVININGTADGNEYGQLLVAGSVVIDGATLNLTASNVTAGDTFVIVDNDGVDAVIGAFDLLAEGANLAIGNHVFTISYLGGDGNDIELTEISCQSVQAGLWSADTTWSFCDGPIPQITDEVNILHAVSFDTDATIQSIDFGPSGDFDVAASGAGLSLNITGAIADFSLIDIDLLGDFTYTNTNYNSDFGDLDGNFNLVLNSDKNITLSSTNSPITGLKSIVTDAVGSTKIVRGRTLLLTGDNDTVFNDNLVIGPSANVFLNQTGAGNVVFNQNISRTSGSPHRISISNDVGETQINGTVSVGQFTTNGTAIVRLSGGAITTASGGANSGDMSFNSPVVVTADTIFTSTGNGEIFFNNTLNDDGIGATSSVVTINNPNNTVFSSVGIINPLDSITTDGLGLSKLNGDINTLISTTFNDNVLLASNSGLSSAVVDIQSDINNGGFDLTFDTSNNTEFTRIDGVLSGTGDFIKEGLGDMSFHSINTMTGNLILNSGSVINKNASNSIFPGVVEFSLADNTQAYLGGGGSGLDTFELIDGQVIKGEGQCQCILDVKSGAIIAPGFSPGNLSLGGFKMATGATLAIELDGTNSSTEYDWISSSVMANLDGDSSGGATLDVALGFIPQTGDQFTILQFGAPFVASGTFNGLPEGGTLSANGILFSISYIGVDGNDVVLTVLGSAISYVDVNVADAGDGSSWSSAFDNLQDALAVSVFGTEIWVAGGVYYPDIGLGQVNNSQDSAFNLINGVKLYGGFNSTETELSQRNPSANITILSGDIDGDDINFDGNNISEIVSDIQGNNAYHVLDGRVVGILTIVDGFTVTSGKAIGSKGESVGGGMICEDNVSGPSLNQMLFIGNDAMAGAGATYGCAQNVRNTVYMNNHSDAGSGAVETFIGGTFDKVIFEGNVAQGSAGALHNSTNSLTISNSQFINNHAISGVGGAISTSGSLEMETVLFLGNKASASVMQKGNSADGGAVYISNTSNATLINVTMTGNNASGNGGALRFASSGNLNIDNTIIWNNQDNSGIGTNSASVSNSVGTIINSTSLIQGFGAGGGNLDEDPRFVTDTNPSTAPTNAGDARLTELSIAIDTGYNSIVTQTTDLDGRKRIFNSTVDMGTYEYFDDLVFKDGFEQIIR